MADNTKKEKIIGIDLGTSNSAASVLVGGKPTVIPSAEGASQYGKAFPSYVAFTDDGQLTLMTTKGLQLKMQVQLQD